MTNSQLASTQNLKTKGNTMKSKITKFAKVAVIGFCLALTFSCSSGNDNTDNSSSSNGGGCLSSSSGVSSSSSVTSGDGSSSSLTGTSGTFVDSRDSKSYKWVKIDELIWFAENLNYAVEGGKCFGDGGKYGTDLKAFLFVP